MQINKEQLTACLEMTMKGKETGQHGVKGGSPPPSPLALNFDDAGVEGDAKNSQDLRTDSSKKQTK